MAKNQNRANASRNAAALRARFKVFDEAFREASTRTAIKITDSVTHYVENEMNPRISNDTRTGTHGWGDDTFNLRASTGIGAYLPTGTLIKAGIPAVSTTQTSQNYRSNRIYPSGRERLVQAIAGNKGGKISKEGVYMRAYVAMPYATAVSNQVWESKGIKWFSILKTEMTDVVQRTWNTEKAMMARRTANTAKRSKDSKGRFI